MRESRFNSDDRMLECESGLEGKAVSVLMGRSDVASVREQPPALRYVDEHGDELKHVVDLLVTMRDGSRYAVLVKTRADAAEHRLERVRNHLARQTPRSFADHYVIVSEDKLPRPIVSAGRLHADVRLRGPFSDDPTVEQVMDLITDTIRVDDVVARSGLGGDAFRALNRCWLDGRIVVLDGTQLDLQASVRPTDSKGVQ